MCEREHASQKGKPKHARLQSLESKTELNRIYEDRRENVQHIVCERERERKENEHEREDSFVVVVVVVDMIMLKCGEQREG
jgi:hypothetical protein